MFENLIAIDKSAPKENLINQIIKVLSGENSSPATLKFISQLQTGKVFDAVFTGKAPGGKGILSIGGNKVVVELPKAVTIENDLESGQKTRIPMNQGRAFKVQVESSGSKPSLKILPPKIQHEKLPDTPETITKLTTRGKTISRFTDIEVFPQKSDPLSTPNNARITKILDSKTVLVNTGSREFAVPVEETKNLEPGTKVNLVFDKTVGGNTSADIKINNPQRIIDFNTIKPYLPARMPVTNMAQLLVDNVIESPVLKELGLNPVMIGRLQDAVKLLVPREGEIPNEKQVRQQVESSGINYEARVKKALISDAPIHRELAKDLKGLLLELYQSTVKETAKHSSKVPNQIIEFRNHIKFAIDNIELNQLSSQISKQENQPIMIQIPNPLSSENNTIQLYVRKESTEDKENAGKEGKHNVAFILDLSFLGKIKINAQIDSEHLSVNIDTESEEIANFINERASDFQAKMQDIETSVECCATSKVKPVRDSLIELLVSQNTSLVNIKT
ncbi:MAG: hypothetical protein F3741_02620 [Nitrospinae bacterium]|nr:hypothetical protein [Nitrospinota bacterium]